MYVVVYCCPGFHFGTYQNPISVLKVENHRLKAATNFDMLLYVLKAEKLPRGRTFSSHCFYVDYLQVRTSKCNVNKKHFTRMVSVCPSLSLCLCLALCYGVLHCMGIYVYVSAREPLKTKYWKQLYLFLRSGIIINYFPFGSRNERKVFFESVHVRVIIFLW